MGLDHPQLPIRLDWAHRNESDIFPLMIIASGGLGLRLLLRLAAVGADGWSVFFGEKVVFTEVAGLLVGRAYRWLGWWGVLVLFTSIKLKKTRAQ